MTQITKLATGSSPAATATRAVGRLPPTLVEDAARRFAQLALGMAGLIVVIEFLQQFVQPDLAPVLGDPVVRLATLASVLMALGIAALRRYRLVMPSTIVAFGLLFETVMAFTISLIETAVPLAVDRPVLGISALGPWIVFVGAIIPNRPVWTLVAALAAASTWPLAHVINSARLDLPPPPFGRLVVWPAINYLMALLAYVAARRWYGTACEAQAAEELGSYRLVSAIGEGGMGEVWKATHLMLARTAAIKLVKPTMLSDSSSRRADLFAKRFRREANAIASLQSPHTVYLYDFGVSQDGRFYYVMELLDGISLQTLVTTFGPQPASRVVFILQQVCQSLEEAHLHGLVHRDLKPSNVMLCKVALDYDFVKVLDFGLAKSIAGDDVTQLTMEGVATGTPGYIAPEVALGEAAIDGRADVYALGCVAYFLLTGTLVFPDSNPVSMALKHVQSAPDRPSHRTELAIPADLERLVMHCLEKKPAQRPASARELLDQLSACAVPGWTDQAAHAWWDRHLPPTSSLRSFAQTAPHTPPVVRKM
jgi:eukaryotic-like serine/threonine-protein kinase